VASVYQFCRVDAKTEDQPVLGFPSYWNIAAFYVVVLDLQPTSVAVLLMVCAVLVFVPIGYVYPSRTTTLRSLTLILTTCGWPAMPCCSTSRTPHPSGWPSRWPTSPTTSS
jgi:phosphatidylcholine synthase